MKSEVLQPVSRFFHDIKADWMAQSVQKESTNEFNKLRSAVDPSSRKILDNCQTYVSSWYLNYKLRREEFKITPQERVIFDFSLLLYAVNDVVADEKQDVELVSNLKQTIAGAREEYWKRCFYDEGITANQETERYFLAIDQAAHNIHLEITNREIAELYKSSRIKNASEVARDNIADARTNFWPLYTRPLPII
ncbi:hypothetical protein HY439_01690 [Candidatus Microgenomates bacterium]|nr:hypothetical protein [Candidatus Microgenomates bacterium]